MNHSQDRRRVILTDSLREDVIRLADEGETVKGTAKRLGIGERTVSKIRKERGWSKWQKKSP